MQTSSIFSHPKNLTLAPDFQANLYCKWAKQSNFVFQIGLTSFSKDLVKVHKRYLQGEVENLLKVIYLYSRDPRKMSTNLLVNRIHTNHAAQPTKNLGYLNIRNKSAKYVQMRGHLCRCKLVFSKRPCKIKSHASHIIDKWSLCSWQCPKYCNANFSLWKRNRIIQVCMVPSSWFQIDIYVLLCGLCCLIFW